jgi:hypothetical protein
VPLGLSGSSVHLFIQIYVHNPLSTKVQSISNAIIESEKKEFPNVKPRYYYWNKWKMVVREDIYMIIMVYLLNYSTYIHIIFLYKTCPLTVQNSLMPSPK